MKKRFLALFLVLLLVLSLSACAVQSAQQNAYEGMEPAEAAEAAAEATKDNTSISDIIRVPFGYLLDWLYNFSRNYGVALLLFSLIVKLVLFPLSVKSKKSMLKMSRLAPLTKALERYGIFELAPSVMYGGELRNVEINRMGVHKGRGLEWLAQHLGCTLENVIAIGDSENDLTMLQMAGLGVAMANSEPSIRAAANVITGSNTENGVAQAVYRYILEG